eukprot:gene10260-8179_t
MAQSSPPGHPYQPGGGALGPNSPYPHDCTNVAACPLHLGTGPRSFSSKPFLTKCPPLPFIVTPCRKVSPVHQRLFVDPSTLRRDNALLRHRTCAAAELGGSSDGSRDENSGETKTSGKGGSSEGADQPGSHQGGADQETNALAGTSPPSLLSKLVPADWKKGLPTVPWGTFAIYQVMLLWVIAYFSIGQIAIPTVLFVFGLALDTLTMRGHALMHLGFDLSLLMVTVLILKHCLKENNPMPQDIFPFKLSGLWPVAVGLGATQLSSQLWDIQQEGDWVMDAAYKIVLLVITPLWEEIIFRGFLMHSLMKHMPTPVAVLFSSVVFAMAHLSRHLFLPHVMLGTLFSLVFMSTRNLVPAIVLHALWNLYVLSNFFRLVA